MADIFFKPFEKYNPFNPKHSALMNVKTRREIYVAKNEWNQYRFLVTACAGT